MHWFVEQNNVAVPKADTLLFGFLEQFVALRSAYASPM